MYEANSGCLETPTLRRKQTYVLIMIPKTFNHYGVRLGLAKSYCFYSDKQSKTQLLTDYVVELCKLHGTNVY